MANTTFNNFPFPNEGQDPHYQTLKSYYNMNDQLMYNNKLRSYFILAGGGSLSFSSSTGLFTWTEDLVVKDAISGYLNVIKYGTDGLTREANLQDGQMIYIEFPTQITSNRELNAKVADSLNENNNFFVFGFRYDVKLYLQNGIIL